MAENQQQDNYTSVPQEREPLLLHGPLTEGERKEKERQEYEKERTRKEDSYRDRQLAIEEGQLATNRKIAIFTLLLAVLTAVGTVISYRSAEAAKSAAETAAGTLALLAKSSDQSSSQTEAAIGHLGRVAGAMEGSLDQNRQAMSASLVQSKAALAQSKAALDASIQAAHSEYRPWIVFTPSLEFMPDAATYDTPPPVGEQVDRLELNRGLIGQVSIENTGRSPARNVLGHLFLGYAPARNPEQIKAFAELAFQQAVSKDSIARTTTTIAPGQTSGVLSNAVPKLTDAAIAAVTSGVGVLFLAGEITYLDADNVSHSTEVCVCFTGQSMISYRYCGVRSDMK